MFKDNFALDHTFVRVLIEALVDIDWSKLPSFGSADAVMVLFGEFMVQRRK